MAYRNLMWAVAGVVALAGVAGPGHAETTAPPDTAGIVEEVHVSAPRPLHEGLSRAEAKRLGKEAERIGEHHRAAEYFRLAGDHARADRALLRASAEKSSVTGRKAEAGAKAVKEQMQRLRASLR